MAAELVRELGRRRHLRLHGDHVPIPAVVSGFANGDRTRSRFRIDL